MNILDFGCRVLGIEYSPLQQTILLAAKGGNLTDEHAALFEKHAGKPWPGPGEQPDEVHVVTGRQSGKTGYLAATLVLHSTFDPATVEGMAPGYVRDVVLVSPTVRQSGIAYARIVGLVGHTKELSARLSTAPTKNELNFDFGVRVGVWTAKGAHLRGLQPKLLLLDEACFLPADGHRADYELVEAVRPGQAMIAGAQIVTISSPWLESGYVYARFRRRAELDGVLVFQAASRELNPHIPQAFLDREQARDPEVFRREFGGEFIGSIGAYLPAESIAACVVSGRTVLPPEKGHTGYVAAVDQAYRRDTWVLGIAHREDDGIVVDRLRGWRPGRGNPVRLESLLPELKAELQPYGIRSVLGDQFSSVTFQEIMRREGLSYTERTFTAQSKPNMYASLKDAIVSQRIELLDHETSLRELRTLECRAMPGGNVRIEAPHGAGFHDDFADVLAVLAHELRPTVITDKVAFSTEGHRDGHQGVATMRF